MKFVFFSGVGYHSFIGGRTVQLAQTLSKKHEVHFVEMPSLRRWHTGTKCCDGMQIHTLLPYSDRKFFQHNAKILSKRIGLDDAHLVVSHPAWQPFVARLQSASVLYDCLDHVSIHAADSKKGAILAEKEAKLIEQQDHILAITTELEKTINRPEKCYLLPNAVPEYLTKIDIPLPKQPQVIGFHGALYEWLDYSLLEEVAKSFPQCILRLVGDVRDPNDLKLLKQYPNVETFPAFRFEDMPKIVGGFTVGIIPFLENVVAKCSDPLKSYEYLAMGRGVVSTVAAAFDKNVFRYADRKQFINELKELLENPPNSEECRAAVTGNYWENRCDRLTEIITGK